MAGPKQPRPTNWPDALPYLVAPVYSPSLSKTQLQSLRTEPDASSSSSGLREIPRELKPGPCANVRITPISDPRHPACGQSGLFAARALPPGSLILPYLGEIHAGSAAAHAASDYDLWLYRGGGGGGGGDDDEEEDKEGVGDVAVDAALRGNEARFVNDYRGVPGAVRANAEFCEVWDARRGERAMAVFVLPAGKKARGGGGGGGGIAKGQEILVSYGRGFWEKRRQEEEGRGGDEEGEVPVQDQP
ncbi:unnamed protein product [Discula destructiva]